MVGLLAVLEIPLVHWSVHLWRSLHQEATVADLDGDVDMDGLMLFSLFVGLIAFTLLYVWLLLHRSRALAMQDVLDDQGLDRALADRRAEAVAGGACGDGRCRLHPRQLRDHDRGGGAVWHGASSGAAGSWRRRSTTPTSTGPDPP